MKTYYMPTTSITRTAATPKPLLTLSRIVIASIISIVLVMGTVYYAQQPTVADKVEWTAQYSVDAGDTLWAIVQSIPGANQHDTRTLVALVKAHNNIGTDIKVGTALVLPTTWEVSK